MTEIGEVSSSRALPAELNRLCDAAVEAQRASYSPYSHYPVGAALLAAGQLFTGANVENASYGLSVCAERNAIAKAVLAGHRDIEAIAVITASSPPATPCGMCRQVLAEFARDPHRTRVITLNHLGERQEFTLAELLPHGFTPAQLEQR